MGYRFFQSDVKFGISLDYKSFVICSQNGIDIYNDIDDFLSNLKKTFEFIISKNEKKDE